MNLRFLLVLQLLGLAVGAGEKDTASKPRATIKAPPRAVPRKTTTKTTAKPTKTVKRSSVKTSKATVPKKMKFSPKSTTTTTSPPMRLTDDTVKSLRSTLSLAVLSLAEAIEAGVQSAHRAQRFRHREIDEELRRLALMQGALSRLKNREPLDAALTMPNPHPIDKPDVAALVDSAGCLEQCDPAFCRGGMSGAQCYTPNSAQDGKKAECAEYAIPTLLECPKGMEPCATQRPMLGQQYQIVANSSSRQAIVVRGSNLSPCSDLILLPKDQQCVLDKAEDLEKLNLISAEIEGGNGHETPKLLAIEDQPSWMRPLLFPNVRSSKAGEYRMCMVQFARAPVAAHGGEPRMTVRSFQGIGSLLVITEDTAKQLAKGRIALGVP